MSDDEEVWYTLSAPTHFKHTHNMSSQRPQTKAIASDLWKHTSSNHILFLWLQQDANALLSNSNVSFLQASTFHKWLHSLDVPLCLNFFYFYGFTHLRSSTLWNSDFFQSMSLPPPHIRGCSAIFHRKITPHSSKITIRTLHCKPC